VEFSEMNTARFALFELQSAESESRRQFAEA